MFQDWCSPMFASLCAADLHYRPGMTFGAPSFVPIHAVVAARVILSTRERAQLPNRRPRASPKQPY